MNKNRPEEIYQEFWKDIICDENGNIDVEQVKKELCDFYFMMNEVPKVYSAVTGGTLSKTMYSANTVINIFEEKYGRKATYVDELQYAWNDITDGCETNADYKEVIFDYLDIMEEKK